MTSVVKTETVSISDQCENKQCQPGTSIEINSVSQSDQCENKVSVQFSSVQDGIYALGKGMRSAPSLRRVPNVAFKTVPVFVGLTMAFSRPFKEDRPAFNASLLQVISGVVSL